MKNYKFFPLLLFYFILLSNISFAQCPDGLTASVNFTGPSGCQCATAFVTGGVYPYTILWSTSETLSTICVNYTDSFGFIVTDALGCTFDTAFQMTGTGFNIAVNATTAYCRNGTATVSTNGGIPPFQYSWNTVPVQTDSIATGLHAGQMYNVSVSDDSGCVLMQQVYIPSGGNLNSGISYNPDTCGHGVGAATGYAVSGVPPYSYLWSTGDTGTSLNNLTAGFYSFTVTDDSGCVSTSNQSLINFSPVQVTHSEVQPSCLNDSGSITLNTTGGTIPYNYFWNTIPPQSTNVASNLPLGLYNCLITDSQGCSANVSVILNDNSSLSAYASAVPDTCNKGVGVATASAFGGVPPYMYQWNQLSASSNPVLSNLFPGQNIVWVTDDSGCVRKANTYISYYSPMHVVASALNASCIFTADGTAAANATGGIPPYTYRWTDGTSASSASGFLPGQYSVFVTDSQGCADYANVNIGYDSISPCAVTVEGTVYNDTSMNCIKDAGETAIGNVMISCIPYGGFKWTDPIGYYNFHLPPGNYSTSQVLPPWHVQLCPAADFTDTLPIAGMDTINDFADVGDAVDLDIHCFGINFPVPGFDYSQSVYYRNQGTKTVNNAFVTVQHDPRITFLYSQPAAGNYNSSTNTITIPVGNLAPYGTYQSWQGQIIVHYNIPSSLTIGTLLSFTDTVFPVVGDTVPLNNEEYCFANVVGPYDPNSIEVTPHGDGFNGYISTDDSVLTYVVRFQNTGNRTAANIVVEVQIDNDLELSTFEMLGQSFQCTKEISASGLGKFSFYGINLPDSNFNEAASHGYFAFRIKQKPGLAELTQIVASAHIYFDFNYPVATNDALNTILGVEEAKISPAIISVSPNPAHDFFNLNIQLKHSSEVSIELYDALGKLLFRTEKEKLLQGVSVRSINAASLATGIYFVKLMTETGEVAGKLVRY